MCGKTYIMKYVREYLYGSLSEKEIEDDNELFEEFIKKYGLDTYIQRNMFIFKK